MLVAPELATVRPHLIRAMYEWCCEQGLTPYLAVFVDSQVQVPMEFVRNNEITFNIGLEATGDLQITNDSVKFKARFGGVLRQIDVPVTHVLAIYGRENGQGMAFPKIDFAQIQADAATNLPTQPAAMPAPAATKEKARPALTRVK